MYVSMSRISIKDMRILFFFEVDIISQWKILIEIEWIWIQKC